MRVELDLEKIKAELAQSTLSAHEKMAAAALAYHQSMNELVQQLTKLKARNKARLKSTFKKTVCRSFSLEQLRAAERKRAG